MQNRTVLALICLAFVSGGSAYGQALQVDGANRRAALFEANNATGGLYGTGEVIRAKVTHDQEVTTIAIVGISEPQPGHGHGGWFHGGSHGVLGKAKTVGGPDAIVRAGVGGIAENGKWNEGVYGSAWAPDEADKTAYGVYGYAACQDDGTNCTKYAVYASGDLAYTGNLVKVSDLKFKRGLQPLESALGSVLDLEVVTYEHVGEPDYSHLNLPQGRQAGFVAQQVALVLPELVTEAVQPPLQDPMAPDINRAGAVQYQALKPLDLLPYLVRAIQEQQAEIEALKASMDPFRRQAADRGFSQGCPH